MESGVKGTLYATGATTSSTRNSSSAKPAGSPLRTEVPLSVCALPKKRCGQSPFFVSDGRSYRKPLTKHYGTEVQPDPTKPKLGRPRKQPERRRDPDLLYGQAIKDKDSRGCVVGVRRRMVFGSVAEFAEAVRRDATQPTAHHQSHRA